MRLCLHLTLTTSQGLALLEQNLKSATSSYPEAAKVVVLVTDGKSQDDVRAAGCILRDLGVDVFAVGEQCQALCSGSHSRVGPPITGVSLHPASAAPEVAWYLQWSAQRSGVCRGVQRGHTVCGTDLPVCSHVWPSPLCMATTHTPHPSGASFC